MGDYGGGVRVGPLLSHANLVPKGLGRVTLKQSLDIHNHCAAHFTATFRTSSRPTRTSTRGGRAHCVRGGWREATTVDIEVDPQCGRFGRGQSDFALQAE